MLTKWNVSSKNTVFKLLLLPSNYNFDDFANFKDFKIICCRQFEMWWLEI